MSMMQKYLPLAQHMGIRFFAGLLLCLVCLVVFVLLARGIAAPNRLVTLDLTVTNALYLDATPFSIAAYKVISATGLPGLWFVSATAGMLLARRRQWLHLVVLAIALAGGIFLMETLKLLFARPRPYFAIPYVVEEKFSFPSGHALLSLIGYGLLAYFVWRSLKNRYARIVLFFAAALYILLVGISRLTLGVHYLSDVLAGYMVGTVWLIFCIIIMNTVVFWRRSGDVEVKTPGNL